MQTQFIRTQLLLGEKSLDILKNIRVAVFGIGGVGGYVCEALVRSGVGAFDLIDNDTVCLSNINRQIIATHKTIGQYKTEVMRERMLEINPDVDVRIGYGAFSGCLNLEHITIPNKVTRIGANAFRKTKWFEGEHKKNHYHVLLCFDGPTTYNTAKEYADRVGSANGVIQPVGSVRGMVRYFCHLDNPDKHQYNESIIQCRNGFDPKDYFSLTISQQKSFKRKVTNFIRDNDITEYGELIDMLMDSDEMDMYDIASQNTFYFTQYIKSKRNMKKSRD